MRLTAPITRLSLSLALMGLAILLSGEALLGERSNKQKMEMELRAGICESLAVQFSTLIAVGDLSTIRVSLRNLVQRDDNIMSAALRTADGKLRAEFGNHRAYWGDMPTGRSTLTHVQVPIFKDNTRWGNVEVRFADSKPVTVWQSVFSPFVLMAIYVFVAGFFGYALLMQHTLKHLDPRSLMPTRVKAALDLLSEGVVVIDNEQKILLANSASRSMLSTDEADLSGEHLFSLKWLSSDAPDSSPTEYPWKLSLTDGESRTDNRLVLDLQGKLHTFLVSCSAILDDDGRTQGAVVTLNEVTEQQRNSD